MSGGGPYRNNQRDQRDLRDDRRRRFESSSTGSHNPYSSRRPDSQSSSQQALSQQLPQQPHQYPSHGRYSSGPARGSSEYNRRPSSAYRGGRGNYYNSRYNHNSNGSSGGSIDYDREHIPKPSSAESYRSGSTEDYGRRSYNSHYRSSYEDRPNRSGNDLIGGPANRGGDIIRDRENAPREYRREYRDRDHGSYSSRSRNSSDSRYYSRHDDYNGSGYQQQKDRGFNSDKMNSYQIPPRAPYNSNPLGNIKKEENYRYKSVSPNSPRRSREGTPGPDARRETRLDSRHEHRSEIKVKSERPVEESGDSRDHKSDVSSVEKSSEKQTETPIEKPVQPTEESVETPEIEKATTESVSKLVEPANDTPAASESAKQFEGLVSVTSEAPIKTEEAEVATEVLNEELVKAAPPVEEDTSVEEKVTGDVEMKDVSVPDPEPESEAADVEMEDASVKKDASSSAENGLVKKDMRVVDGVGSVVKDESKQTVVELLEANVKTEVVPVQEGCIFPLNRIESKVWDLKQSLDSTKSLKYLRSKNPIKDFSSYSFYNSNLLVFKQADGHNIFNKLSEVKELVDHKNKVLLAEYLSRGKLWRQMCLEREKQIKSYRPSLIESAAPSSDKQSETATPGNDRSSRRGRYHGDSIRTEAELEEILQYLKSEEEKDPLKRARKGAAIIPDLYTNPVDRYAKRFLDTDNLVLDKSEFAARLKTDPVDNFTEEEHEKFCEAYSMWPKKFGRVSQFMGGLRTPEECVLHYYKTKKATNYKQLVASRNRRSTRKATANRRKASEKPKSNGLHVDTPDQTDTVDPSSTVDTPEPEVEYTDTGRRKRAAAPVFSGTARTTPPVEEQSKKKPRGAKRKSEEAETDSAQDDNPTDGSNGKKAHISSYWSVNEINMFPKLFETYGTDWEQISRALGSKSAVMVRNYYLRNMGGVAWYDTSDQRSEIKREIPQPLTPKNLEQKPVDFMQQQQQQQSVVGGYPQFPVSSFYPGQRPPTAYGTSALPPLTTPPSLAPLGSTRPPSFLGRTEAIGTTSLLNYHEPQQAAPAFPYDYPRPALSTTSAIPPAPRPNIVPPKKTSIMSLLNDDNDNSNRSSGFAGLMNPQAVQGNSLDALAAAAGRQPVDGTSNNINNDNKNNA